MNVFTNKNFTLAGLKSWNNFHYPLKEYELLTDSLIERSIDRFWTRINSKLKNKDNHLIAIFRIKNITGTYLTIGKLQVLNWEDKDQFRKYVRDYLSLKNEEYKNTLITEIIISFGIRKGIVDSTPKHIENIQVQKIRELNVPITLDPLNYGYIIYFDRVNNTYIVQNENFIFKIQQKHNKNHVEVIKENKTFITFLDEQTEKGFTRSIDRNQYFYEKQGDQFKLYLTIEARTNQFISRTRKDKQLRRNFLTMDIETREIEGNIYPYLISWFDSKKSASFFLNDFNSSDEMIDKAILSLCRKENNEKIVYIHNLSNFDIVFLLRRLAQIGSHLKIIINNGKFIDIEMDYSLEDGDMMFLYFRDSYNILLSSLAKLGKSFGVETQKSIFPHKFVDTAPLDYQGKFPELKYYYNVTKETYNNYIQTIDISNWNLKQAAIEYCETDCISLWQVLDKFNNLFYKKFKINIHSHPTLPSLAFRLFRTHYLVKDQIIKIFGPDYKQIKQSYTGGANDMYIPSNDKGEKVYCYDVNSLYPFVMKTFPMPIGQMNYFMGDIRKTNTKAFGFFYCKVTCPENLLHPIIQLHIKTKNGLRTVAPTGTFETMIFSPEMDNALKYGYQFEILYGYTFDQAIIFDTFVEDLYKIRLEYPKTDPMNYIAKINMNSLYGKFGMRDEFDLTQIIDNEEFKRLTSSEKAYLIKEIVELDEKYLIQLQAEELDLTRDASNNEKNINISVASAITSYSRIVMSQFKNHPEIKLFYSDTDSIYTNLSPDEMNKIIPGSIDNKKLGALKLESIATQAIFLAPKVYALELESGKIQYKVKGLKQESIQKYLKFSDFEQLLLKNQTLTINQSKWYRSLSKSTISILDTIYTLKQKDNKRKLIYNESDKCISTRAYSVENNIISNNPSQLWNC